MFCAVGFAMPSILHCCVALVALTLATSAPSASSNTCIVSFGSQWLVTPLSLEPSSKLSDAAVLVTVTTLTQQHSSDVWQPASTPYVFDISDESERAMHECSAAATLMKSEFNSADDVDLVLSLRLQASQAAAFVNDVYFGHASPLTVDEDVFEHDLRVPSSMLNSDRNNVLAVVHRRDPLRCSSYASIDIKLQLETNSVEPRVLQVVSPLTSASPTFSSSPSVTPSLASLSATTSVTKSISITPSGTPAPSVSPSAIPSGPEQIKLTDMWKYFDQGNVNAPTWAAVSFDDSTWSAGRAPLGYGFATLLTQVSFGANTSKRYITTYFRKAFTMSRNPGSTYSGSLTLQCVDGCVVYMNGAEISRINMPAAPTVITFTSNALLVLNAIPTETVIPITDANVQDGVNVIAVEVHKQNGGVRFLYLEAKLLITDASSPSPSPSPSTAGAVTSASPSTTASTPTAGSVSPTPSSLTAPSASASPSRSAVVSAGASPSASSSNVPAGASISSSASASASTDTGSTNIASASVSSSPNPAATSSDGSSSASQSTQPSISASISVTPSCGCSCETTSCCFNVTAKQEECANAGSYALSTTSRFIIVATTTVIGGVLLASLGWFVYARTRGPPLPTGKKAKAGKDGKMAKRGSKRPGKGGSAARLPKSPRGTASRNAREPRRRSDGVESSEDEWTSNDEDAASQGVTSSVAASTSNAAVPLMPAPAQQPSMQHTQQDVNREWDRLAAELQAAPSAAAQQFEEQPQLHNGAPSAPWRRDVSQEMQQGTWWQEDDSDVYFASPAYVPQRATGAWQEAPQAASPRSQLHTEPTRWHRPDAQDMYVQVQEPDRSRSPIRRPSAQLSRVSMQPGQQQSARRDRRPSVVKEIVLPDSRRFVVQRVPVDSVYDPPAAPPQLPQEIDDDAELVRELSGVRTAQPASWSTPAQAHKQPVRRLQRPSSGSMMRLVRMKRVKSRQPPAQAQGSSGFAGPFSAVSQQPRATEYFY